MLTLVMGLSGLLFSQIAAGTEPAEFDPAHYCYSNKNMPICQEQIAIRTTPANTGPNTNDFYIVPHRGYWGIDPSIPENSVVAIDEATDQGYSSVELDIARVNLEVTTDSAGRPDTDPDATKYVPPNELKQFIASHDFVMPRLTTSNSPDFMISFSVDDLSELYLRERDETPSDYTMMTLLDAFQAAARNDTVIMIDTRPIKAHMVYDSEGHGECVAFCQYSDGGAIYTQAYAENIRDVIRYAIDNEDGIDYTRYLVFKVPLPAPYLLEFIDMDEFRKVLWMVQANPTKLSWYAQNVLGDGGFHADIQDLADFVDAWDLNYGASVSCYETAYKPGTNDIRIQPFTRLAEATDGAPFSEGSSPYTGLTYTTVMDYIYNTTGLRSGTFSGEPVGRRGLVNEYANWRMSPDARANQFAEIDYDYAGIMVITTDRPDFWEQMQTVLGAN